MINEKPATINCYTCGKGNVGRNFCDETCHQKWKDAHPIKKKNGCSNLTIKEIQERILGWAKDPRHWKGAVPNRKVEDMPFDMVKNIFS